MLGEVARGPLWFHLGSLVLAVEGTNAGEEEDDDEEMLLKARERGPCERDVGGVTRRREADRTSLIVGSLGCVCECVRTRRVDGRMREGGCVLYLVVLHTTNT